VFFYNLSAIGFIKQQSESSLVPSGQLVGRNHKMNPANVPSESRKHSGCNHRFNTSTMRSYGTPIISA
jgi:hypothetical protein